MLTEVAREVLGLGVNSYLRFFLKKNPSQKPQVLYAGQTAPTGEIVTGGRVKLISLAKEFPERSLNGNILYLVTSGLPKGALQWVQACRQKGIKVVINQNGVAYPAWAGPEECARINKRNRQLLENADLIVYQSQFCKLAVEKWVGVIPTKSVVLHNPVDTGLFKLAQSPPPSNGPIRLLLMGSHRHEERVEVAIRALHDLKTRGINARLQVAGPLGWDRAQEDMTSLVASLNLGEQVEFSGPYLQEEAPALYQSADILIHLQDKDASPTVPLEAMACGIQVIAPRSGGLPELIPSHGGILLDVKEDWEKFHLPTAQAVSKAVEELKSKDRSPSETHRWVEEKFSAQGWIAAHDKVFQGLLHD